MQLVAKEVNTSVLDAFRFHVSIVQCLERIPHGMTTFMGQEVTNFAAPQN